MYIYIYIYRYTQICVTVRFMFQTTQFPCLDEFGVFVETSWCNCPENMVNTRACAQARNKSRILQKASTSMPIPTWSSPKSSGVYPLVMTDIAIEDCP